MPGQIPSSLSGAKQNKLWTGAKLARLYSTHSNPLFLGGQSVGQRGPSARGCFSQIFLNFLGRGVVGMLGVT